MDMKLTDAGDIEFIDGEMQFVTGLDAIAQHVRQRLQTWQTESGTVYDIGAGVPYLGVIFGRKNPDLNAVRFILEQQVLATPGMISVELQVAFDPATRVLTVTGGGVSQEGNVDFSELVKVAS